MLYDSTTSSAAGGGNTSRAPGIVSIIPEPWASCSVFPPPAQRTAPSRRRSTASITTTSSMEPILPRNRGLTCLRGRGGRERGRYGLAYGDPLVWQLVLLHKEIVDRCQGLIHQIKIIDSLWHNVLQGHVGKIEWTAITLPAVMTLDHRARDRKAMDAADERSVFIEATAAVLQEHTGRGGIDDAPRVILLETSQQALPRLWRQGSDCLREVMRLNGKYRELLVAAPVTASMTGDLRWVTLRNGLPEGVNTLLQALVLLVGVGHRPRSLSK